MPLPSAPNTMAVAEAIAGYMSALTYTGGAPVYKLVQVGEIKNVSNQVTNGAACLEIYGSDDDSQPLAFGGSRQDPQSFYLLSMVSLDDAQAAEALIFAVRDALVVPLSTHIRLGDTTGVIFLSGFKPHSGKFLDVPRNGQYLRAHVIELMVSSQWQVTLTS
ncbi:hypothetical protein KSF_095960 [Reticulibacter mediterranei]|uniref:Uncharacterized protein n=1 Tax=Reticulibacter mediterranei TaxID=2778369 RepID=A0A8J3N8C5_9CHLR|nr:hypothetical protein [Reticulibacter mediterranei]GHO99548.1 hypothetical protein KSF_095960 [Reticulibacter mediterranei]